MGSNSAEVMRGNRARVRAAMMDWISSTTAQNRTQTNPAISHFIRPL